VVSQILLTDINMFTGEVANKCAHLVFIDTTLVGVGIRVAV